MNPRSLLWMRNRATWDKRYNPALVMDIARGGLADMVGGAAITFTRASSAWAFNSAGMLVPYSTNVPRIVPSPVGVMSAWREPQSTNLLTESEFRNGVADATARGGHVSGTTFSGLTGNTGLAIGHDGLTTSYAYKTNYTAINGTTYAFTVFVRMDDGLAPSFGSASVSNVANDFQLVVGGLGSAVSSVSPLNYVVREIAGSSGMYSVTVTGTWATVVNADQSGLIKYTTNSSRTFKVSGYQLEIQPVATSYIPTTTAQVTRSRDVLTVAYARTALAPTSMLFDGVLPGNTGTTMCLATNTTTTNWGLVMNPVGLTYVTDNVSSALVISGTTTFGARLRAGVAQDNTGRTGVANGGTAYSDANPMIGTLTGLVLGQAVTGSDSAAPPLYIHGLRMFNTRLTNAQLQALTTS